MLFRSGLQLSRRQRIAADSASVHQPESSSPACISDLRRLRPGRLVWRQHPDLRQDGHPHAGTATGAWHFILPRGGWKWTCSGWRLPRNIARFNPIAQAILTASAGLPVTAIAEAHYELGFGLKVRLLDGRNVLVGSPSSRPS